MRPLSTLRTIILNFESSFKKAESKAIYREDAKIAGKSINLSFLKKVVPSGLLASLAPSRFMQLKFWSEACLVNKTSRVRTPGSIQHPHSALLVFQTFCLLYSAIQ